jgi:hypothetical protein
MIYQVAGAGQSDKKKTSFDYKQKDENAHDTEREAVVPDG